MKMEARWSSIFRLLVLAVDDRLLLFRDPPPPPPPPPLTVNVVATSGLRFLLNRPLGGAADGVVGLLPFTTAVVSAVAASIGVSASFF